MLETLEQAQAERPAISWDAGATLLWKAAGDQKRKKVERSKAAAVGNTPEQSSTIAICPVKLDAMVKQFPTLRPVLVDGLLRSGETANIIASPKIGKSFMAGNLACCIASGKPWFDHDVTQGNVLILDNELHPETLATD